MQYDYVVYQNAPTANKQEWVPVTKEEKEWFIDSFKMERSRVCWKVVSGLFMLIGVIVPISSLISVDWSTELLNGLILVFLMGGIGLFFLLMGWAGVENSYIGEQQADWIRTHDVFKKKVYFRSKNVHARSGNHFVRVVDEIGHELETGFAVSREAFYDAENLVWWAYFYENKHGKWHVWVVEDGPVGRPLKGMW